MASPPGTNVTPLQARETRKRTLSMSTAHDLVVDDPQNHKKIQQLVASVHTRCSLSSRPSLQNLPLELLESIFLYSANLALPRSCPSLGAKLSSRITRLRFFMTGFHDTWDQCFGNPMSWVNYEGWESRFKDDFPLQSDLLSMPWVDIEFILEAQQAWADKYARGRCYQHWEERALATPVPDLYEKSFHAHNRYMQHVLQHEKETWKFDARACFEADYERALQSPPFRTGFGGNVSFCIKPEIHPYVRIPVDLLDGPWDEEKKRRLFWLVRAEIMVELVVEDDGIEDIWKVVIACINAVMISPENPDPLLINCLIAAWTFKQIPKDDAYDVLVKLSERVERGGDTQDIRNVMEYIITRINNQVRWWDNESDNNSDNYDYVEWDVAI
ncbi:hypothetical protein E4U31_007209 [Claviceps sp. LM219 group G6]|nr:hypothetical protein E4U31_007209 [Claviceps sp. LM219 group G6]KAG6103571.1 hypothetical protein E4U14_006185 [Claviceps sp. LM454 group G7]